MQSSVRVARDKPRPRDKLEGVAGRLEVKLRSCSTALGDLVDSYLHVGTGSFRLVLDEAQLRRAAAARTRQQLEQLVYELSGRIQLDYLQFPSTAGRPVVPGSSVKGNVRSRLELSFAPKDGVVRCCLVRATEEPLEPPEPGEHGWRHFRIWRRALEFEREPACDYSEGEEGQVCLCCDLFGTAGLQGLVEFSDFPAERAAIERVSLPTGEKLEAAKPGSTFAGRVAFRNLEAWELGLLLYGMGLRESRLGRPVLLGKVKYRRYPNLVFGVVRYEVAALELAPFSQPLDAGGTRIEPGVRVEGEPLDGLVRALVEAARAELDGELLDVDEVRELERVSAKV